LAKILLFYVNEFIRQTFGELGVSLVVADSEASATAYLLTSLYGFTFFSRFKDLKWIETEVDIYKEKIMNRTRRKRTPEINQEIRDNYFKRALEPMKSYRSKYQNLPSIFKDVDPDFYSNVEQLHDAMIEIGKKQFNTKKDKQNLLSEVDKLLDKMRQTKNVIYKEEYKENEPDTTDSFYSRQINVYLDHYIADDQDTFLYLKNNNNFHEKMKAFAGLFYKERPTVEPEPTTVIVIDDDDEEEKEEEEEEDDIEIIQSHRSVDNGIRLTQIIDPPLWLEPTELDMILYRKLFDEERKRRRIKLENEIHQLTKKSKELADEQERVNRSLREKKEELSRMV
jgi:hypothetical protein